jgi:hypothetical protein
MNPDLTRDNNSPALLSQSFQSANEMICGCRIQAGCGFVLGLQSAITIAKVQYKKIILEHSRLAYQEEHARIGKEL